MANTLEMASFLKYRKESFTVKKSKQFSAK